MEHELKPLTVTIEKAIQLSSIKRTKLYQLISDGHLKTVTVGRRRLVVYASLEALAHGGSNAAA